jgi:hypothetical protein
VMSASLTSYLLRYLLRVGDKFRSSGRQAVELALDQRLSDAAIGPPVTTTFLSLRLISSTPVSICS